MVNKIPHAPNKFNLVSALAYYKRFLNTGNQKFTFSPTSEDEILKLIKDTNPEKAAGIDNLSGRFSKYSALCKLCNLSMKRFKRPNHYIREGPKQIQKAIAQFLLPLVSIAIEKVIHNQTENFLGKNKILYKYQSGFSKSFSTNSCLTLLTDKINKGFQFGKDTGLILIDLEKAFHTTDHEILLKKMVCIGF